MPLTFHSRAIRQKQPNQLLPTHKRYNGAESDGTLLSQHFDAFGVRTATGEWSESQELSRYRWRSQEGSETDDLTTTPVEEVTLTTPELVYMQTRHYDPGLGRFIMADSIPMGAFSPQGLNRYTYCTNDPVNASDAKGTSFVGKDYGLPEDFWNWYHRSKDFYEKGVELTRKEACNLYDYYVKYERAAWLRKNPGRYGTIAEEELIATGFVGANLNLILGLGIVGLLGLVGGGL